MADSLVVRVTPLPLVLTGTFPLCTVGEALVPEGASPEPPGARPEPPTEDAQPEAGRASAPLAMAQTAKARRPRVVIKLVILVGVAYGVS
jgi:hypothetical protein